MGYRERRHPSFFDKARGNTQYPRAKSIWWIVLLWNAYVSPSTYDTLTAKGVMQRRVLQRYARGAHLSMSMQERELSTREYLLHC